MKKFSILITLFLIIVLLSYAISKPNIANNKILENTDLENETAIQTFSESSSVFISQKIPDYIYNQMLGKSIPIEYKDKVDLSNLSYLQLSYIGFDSKTHTGEMIVNTNLADDVLEIFKELYDIKYKIEKIKLIDEYNANDELSMSDNNTSCFCYRVVSGSKRLSNHAKRNCNRYKSII